MIEDIWIDPAVAALRPDFAVLVLGVYGLRNGATDDRWNWRQCVRTRITEETTDALFLLERLAPMSLEELDTAGKELVKMLEEVTPGVRVESRLVGHD